MTEKYGLDELTILIKENRKLQKQVNTLKDALGRAIFHASLRGWGTREGHELAEVLNQMIDAVREENAF